MKESRFIDQNKEQWQHYEDILKGKSGKPDELNDLFIQVTDDLSYARSFYPNRTVRVYLNNLAQNVFIKIYSHRKRKQSFLKKYLLNDLPAILYSARKELLVCFMVFVLTFIVGVFSSRLDPEYSAQVLGEEYVKMTKSNVEQGKPMNVYASGDQMYSFLRIAYNNLRVDFLTFVTGLFLGIGSIFVLAYNGVMVGVFQYLFYGTGYLTFSILTIWLHGTLEIFTMILSAMAGLVFGKGLLFPGTYSRLQAFRISAKKGVKILLAVIPLTLTAAFIESFVTGQTSVPLIIKASLIITCLIFILFYFVWYPYYKFSKKSVLPEEDTIPVFPESKVTFNDIKTSGEIITDAFKIWRSQLRSIILRSILLSSLLVLLVSLSEGDIVNYHFVGFQYFPIVKVLRINAWFSVNSFDIWPILSLSFAVFATIIQHFFFRKYFKEQLTSKQMREGIFFSFISYNLTLLLFFSASGNLAFYIFTLLVFPLIISLNANVYFHGARQMLKGISSYFHSFFTFLLLNVSLLLLIVILFLIISSPIFYFMLDAIIMTLKISDHTILSIEKVVVHVFGLSIISTSIALYIHGNLLCFLSANERFTATALKKSLNSLWV